MPVAVKPLFRPEALHKKLAAFQVPSRAAAARDKLARWAEFLSSPAALTKKETELLPEFLGDVFRDVLGYTGPAGATGSYTFQEQPRVEVDGKFADAALGRFPLSDGPPRYLVAVEGKGPTDPLDLPHKGRKKSAVDQALGYAVNFPCDWYLVTNLRETRLYHKGHDQFTYERFLTSALAADDGAFRRFVFLLGAVRVAPADGPGHLDELLKASRESGKKLTDELYAVYADLRRKSFEAIRAANPDRPPEAVLAATQKILDRVLFVCFCEDRELLPADSIRKAFRHKDEYDDRPVWANFKTLFRWIDQGNAARDIPAYNGGLFQKDAFIDSLTVPDAVCRGFDVLAGYEYGLPTEEEPDKPPVDVEILGHIFEQSISDLEELHRAITAGGEPIAEGATPALPSPPLRGERGEKPAAAEAEAKRGPSKRKKEGAFYTPAFVTRYIVGETLKPVLADRFERLRAGHAAQARGKARDVLADPSAYDTAGLSDAQAKALVKFWEAWQDELATVRIVDPSCGSGAFLIEAFDQMLAEYQRTSDRLTELRGPRLFDIDRTILTSNLYGVDLNPEAVEICRLSLWIKTAQQGKQLTSLDHTIVCGNSVVGAEGQSPLQMWQKRFPEVFEAGGFDVVIGNPPYVRQEWIKKDKPYLAGHYRAYDGVADLYVYFYELGLTVLRPGGRLGFIVTNKWMKAGYGEALRKLYAEAAWVESVVDFGHAKSFFPDADVFPSILIARKPEPEAEPPAPRVCVIPREQVRIDDLSRQIAAEGVAVPRDRFGPAAWNLEPPGVAALMDKLRRVGVPLKEFAGVAPLRGVVTGFNEAFVVDTPTRNRLVSEHPRSADVIRKYLRGQDIERWTPEWSGEWMIFARRGIQIGDYPAIKRHLEHFRSQLEPKPKDWIGKDWAGRKPGTYKWYELQDPIEYWREFEKPKIMYQDIAWNPRFCFDTDSLFGNNTVYILPTSDPWLLATLNSPVVWWFAWRTAQHGKDEALRFFAEYMITFPVPQPNSEQQQAATTRVNRLCAIARDRQSGNRAVLDWLRHEFGVEKASQKLQALDALGPDDLIAEVKKARGKAKPLSVADVKRLKDEHAASVAPLRELAAEATQLERRVSELVNAAYGLTPAEVALLWETAPPRTPLAGDPTVIR